LALTCGIQSDDTVACWGFDEGGDKRTVVPNPNEVYLQISSGNTYTCAIRTDDRVVCWGFGAFGQTEPPLLLRSLVPEPTQTLLYTCALLTLALLRRRESGPSSDR
jgi:alpha-tubulin suppressor-like RCC1 family protein